MNVNDYEKLVAKYDSDPRYKNYDFSVARARIAELEAENKRAWGERDHYLRKLQERNTQLQQAEAENEGLRSRRLPCAEAEVAQRRYEDAEAVRDRFSAILDRGLTIMNDKQDIVGTLALRDAAMAYDADLRASAKHPMDFAGVMF